HTRRFIPRISDRTHFGARDLGSNILLPRPALVPLDLTCKCHEPKLRPTHVLPSASELVLHARLSLIWRKSPWLRRINCSAHIFFLPFVDGVARFRASGLVSYSSYAEVAS